MFESIDENSELGQRSGQKFLAVRSKPRIPCSSLFFPDYGLAFVVLLVASIKVIRYHHKSSTKYVYA